MSSISKQIAETLIKQNGFYHPDDTIASKIVTYNNQFDGGLTYAIVYPYDDQMKYENSPACDNVKTLWLQSAN